MPRIHGDLLRSSAQVAAGEIKIGDFVALDASGKVKVAAASDALVGMAISYAKADGAEVMVADHPQQEYLIEKSATAPVAQTDYNLNYDIVASVSTSYESKHKLDSATGAATATLPLRAVGPSRQKTAPGLADKECVVRINNHAEKAGVAGV